MLENICSVHLRLSMVLNTKHSLVFKTLSVYDGNVSGTHTKMYKFRITYQLCRKHPFGDSPFRYVESTHSEIRLSLSFLESFVSMPCCSSILFKLTLLERALSSNSWSGEWGLFLTGTNQSSSKYLEVSLMLHLLSGFGSSIRRYKRMSRGVNFFHMMGVLVVFLFCHRVYPWKCLSLWCANYHGKLPVRVQKMRTAKAQTSALASTE